jgi:hypothetical protein
MKLSPSHKFVLIGGVLITLATQAQGQWKDRRFLGAGGESNIATDAKGNVYVTAHQPCKVFVSHDWGATFPTQHEFPDAYCDMNVITWPNGNVNVAFIRQNLAGLGVYLSNDKGATFEKGSALDGPLDREWMAPNLVNNELYMDYSHGFIGGPKSTGVFLAASTDQGKTFTERSRVDAEPDGDYPVDPYLQTSSDGRIYAMWSTSKDYNLIDKFDFSYSTDNGKTFQGHRFIGALHKTRGDCQERWVLGCISATGPKTVLAVYPDYAEMTYHGKPYHPLLLYYRMSTDGGETFTSPQPITPKEELDANIKNFEEHKRGETNYPYYIQTLPWTCVDPSGRFYIAYEDNREGQSVLNDANLDVWQVRFASLAKPDEHFSVSERVSDNTTSKRPPLDFLSCAADGKNAYVAWTQVPNTNTDWAFSGDLYIGHRPITEASH